MRALWQENNFLRSGRENIGKVREAPKCGARARSSPRKKCRAHPEPAATPAPGHKVRLKATQKPNFRGAPKGKRGPPEAGCFCPRASAARHCSQRLRLLQPRPSSPRRALPLRGRAKGSPQRKGGSPEVCCTQPCPQAPRCAAGAAVAAKLLSAALQSPGASLPRGLPCARGSTKGSPQIEEGIP